MAARSASFQRSSAMYLETLLLAFCAASCASLYWSRVFSSALPFLISRQSFTMAVCFSRCSRMSEVIPAYLPVSDFLAGVSCFAGVSPAGAWASAGAAKMTETSAIRAIEVMIMAVSYCGPAWDQP